MGGPPFSMQGEWGSDLTPRALTAGSTFRAHTHSKTSILTPIPFRRKF